MSVAHHTRSHAQWAASATARNVTCAGAIAMETMCEDKETEAAAWGTCAHQISERCLRNDYQADKYLDTVEKSGKFSFTVDEEMANCSQVYVDYCRDRLAEYRAATGQDAQFWIEQKLTLASLNPPLKAGGTGDFGMHFPLWRMLEIVDLKGGRGVGDGKPTWEDIHVADLIDWSVDLLSKMNVSKLALDAFEALNGSRIAFDAWAENWLTTGACVFCPAEGICPKRRKEALSVMGDTAKKWFEEPTTDAPLVVGNAPEIASPEELAHWLDGLEALEAWIKGVRGYAHNAAERGVQIPGWVIVDKIGNRAWMEKDEMKLAAALKAKLTLTDDQVFERSVRSVAQIEKVLGAKRKADLSALEKELWEKPVKDTNLVSAGKTTRPAAKGLTERHHETL
jgi:hypothetical protein